ncbi:MAG: AMP-binding protein, partial [Pseudonocardiaceae bacterium]
MSASEGIALPLSAAQREIWFAEQQLNTANRVYKIGEYIEIHGPVSPIVFETALRRVVEEVDSLHVRFVEGNDGPRQVVQPSSGWLMPVVDVSKEPDPHAAAQAWMTADIAKPMDLTRGALFSYALLELGPDLFVWYQGYHHIVMDRFGFALVARRLAEMYTALAEGQECDQNVFGSLRQLLDSDAAYRASEQFGRDQEYWIKRFADRPEPTRLVGRSSGPAKSVVHRTAVWYGTEKLQVAARRAGVRGSRLVIAAAAVYVHRLTGAKDVVVGLPVTARQDPVLKRVPGVVSNMVPLRLSVRPDMSLTELIGRVTQDVREAVEHQRYRGEDLHRDLGLPGSSGTPFAPMINIMSFDYDLRFAGHRATAHNLSVALVSDLTIAVWDRRDGSRLQVDFQAHPEVCGVEDLTAHLQRFLGLVKTIAVTDPDRPISRIDILSPDERTRLLVDYNDTAVEVSPACLPELFQTQVAATPEAVAVVFEDTTLTYRQLNAAANRLAHALLARGVGPEQVVALALPRSADLIVAILGVLKAGAAYLPLDPDYPPTRIAFILGDAHPALLLTQTEGGLPGAGLTPRLVLDDPDTVTMLRGCPDTDLTDAHRGTPLIPQHPAYVIYTSGSTGTPKGVTVTHAGIPSLAAAQIERLDIDARSRVLAFASPSFDASFSELCMALLSGAALVVAPAEQLLPGEPLVALVTDRQVSHVTMPPSVLAVLPVGDGLPAGVTVVVAGEAWPPELVAAWSAGRRMVNAYGPTETTVCATMSDPLSDATRMPPPIGGPIANTRVYVLDGGLRPVPVGVVGELYVAGVGLA